MNAEIGMREESGEGSEEAITDTQEMGAPGLEIATMRENSEKVTSGLNC